MILGFFDVLLVIITLILTIFPLIIYLVYGTNNIKHPKIRYNKIESFLPPSNGPPSLINSLFVEEINKKIGEINMGCFYFTLLDLINRKYVSVKVVTKKYKIANKNKLNNISPKKSDLKYGKVLDKIILRIDKKGANELYSFEKNVLECAYSLKHNGHRYH